MSGIFCVDIVKVILCSGMLLKKKCLFKTPERACTGILFSIAALSNLWSSTEDYVVDRKFTRWDIFYFDDIFLLYYGQMLNLKSQWNVVGK